MSKAPEPPTLPAAPTFKNSYVYDESGNLAGSTTLDASGNIVYKPKQLTGTEAVNKAAIESTKTSLLQRLYQTPAEYTKAAQTEADAWAANQNKVAGDQFTKDTNRIGEVSNQRGLMGSKAYTDIIKNREKTQSDQNVAISNTATSMRDSLLNNKKAQDYNLYNLYAGASNDYSNKAMQGLSAASNLSGQINNFNQNSYTSSVNAANTDYQNRMANYSATEPWRNYIMPVATSAAMVASKVSDRRLKKNISPAFKVAEVQFYTFEYDLSKWPEGALAPQPGIHVGVMADEVRHIPDAVDEGALYGFDMVRYDVVRRHLNMENA